MMRRMVLASLLASLVLVAPDAGWVLCVGADGHLALERGGARCGEPAQPTAAPGHCGACVDLPLPAGGLTRIGGFVLAGVTTAPAATPGPVSLAPPAAPLSLPLRHANPLRTVILRL